MDHSYSYDYLPGTTIYLHQHKEMFRCNTDTALLGQFMKIKKGETLLDIGTNNGALLLYAMKFHPTQMIGVDINEEACELARKNIEAHQLEHVRILHGDIKEIELEPVNVIVCNPPYFKVDDEKRLNQNQALSFARHEVHLQLHDLVEKVKELLKDNGRFYLVHRGDRFVDIAWELREAGIEIKRAQFVYDEDKADARSVLIEACKGGKPNCRILNPIILKR